MVAYGANAQTNEYTITHLNAGGDNLTHKIKGFTFSPHSSSVANQVDADIFNLFGADAQIEIDFAKANFDWNRAGFPDAIEAHVYVMFTFPAAPASGGSGGGGGGSAPAPTSPGGV
jgi:hypothetical protein